MSGVSLMKGWPQDLPDFKYDDPLISNQFSKNQKSPKVCGQDVKKIKRRTVKPISSFRSPIKNGIKVNNLLPGNSSATEKTILQVEQISNR